MQMQRAHNSCGCPPDCLCAQVVVENATRECNQLLEVISTNTAEVETKAQAAVEKEAQLKIDSENIKVLMCVCACVCSVRG